MAPVLTGDDGVAFAPLGLSNMLNTGGTVCDVVYRGAGCWRVSTQGEGTLVAFAGRKPLSVVVLTAGRAEGNRVEGNRAETDVDYDHSAGVLRVAVGQGVDTVDVQF